MMRSLWIAKTGLEGQQTSMDVISNNLANVATNGFKRGRAVFQDLMYQTLRQPGARWATPPSCPWPATGHRRAWPRPSASTPPAA